MSKPLSPTDSDNDLSPEDAVSGMHSVYELEANQGVDESDADDGSEDELAVEDEVIAEQSLPALAPAPSESRFASLPPRARTDSTLP
jgi:hypothetical protein